MRQSERIILIVLVLGFPVFIEAHQQVEQQPVQGSDLYQYPEAAKRYKERYDKALASAAAAYTATLTDATDEYNLQLTNATDKYTLASRKARKEYLDLLATSMYNEFRAKRTYRGQWVKYVRDLNTVVPLTPIQEHWSLSYTYEARGDYDGAIRHIAEAQKLSGNFYGVYSIMRIGYLYTLKGDYYKGEEAYLAAVKISPTSITPLSGLLYCYVVSVRTEKSIETAEALIKLDPMNYDANKALAIAAFTKSDYEISAGYYYRLSVAFPFDMTSATNLGWCYAYMKKYSESQAIFGSVLVIEPTSQEAKEGYAYCTNMLKYMQSITPVEENPDGDDNPDEKSPDGNDPGTDK